MSRHSMLLNCQDCNEEFYMDMEYHSPESLKVAAETTSCPECKSKNWRMTDGCER